MADSLPLSVSELNARIRLILEGGLPALWIKGEISQYTAHRSGHIYFTLCDERSQISCVIWRGRSQEVLFTPQIGDLVLAHGRVSVYERGGRYQFDCYQLRPAGVGDLAQAFEKLKQRLAAEGLFALERKIALPPVPERVGLVTSQDGAALQDILKVARERAPWAQFQLIPVHVQGSGAAAEIAAAIRQMDAAGWAQLIIVGRGGGAPEDLWAFNEAAVVRAVANCATPIVSAVGHEVDVTLCDLAADLRAPTPTAAAEMCLPDRLVLDDRLRDAALRMRRSLQMRLIEWRRWIEDHADVILKNAALAAWREESQKCDELSRRLDRGMTAAAGRRRKTLEAIAARLSALSPLSILSRGYSIVQREDGSKPIVNALDLQADDPILIIFCQGRARARITTSGEEI